MKKIDIAFNDLMNKKETQNIINKLKKEKNICPNFNDIFKAFDLCPLSKAKVVIFGQDPYHQRGVADGLAFSTKNKRTPASLKNIFKELKSEYPNVSLKTNNLDSWAKQGVLLLNSYLTGQENKPLSHKDIGWKNFINSIIYLLNKYSEKIIFVLWGNDAKKYLNIIDLKKHYILTSSHPSPLSANKGFFGNQHFLKINEILKNINKKEIDWDTL